MISNRKSDVEAERIIASYMDDLYKDNGYWFVRVKDSEAQKRGVDLLLRNQDGDTFYVDEKSAIKYMDRQLNTFAFEIYTNNTVNNEGWFTSDYMWTTHYSLIYPKSKTNDVRHLDSIEAILIDKSKLKNYVLGSLKFSVDELIHTIKEYGREYNGRKYYSISNNIQCVWSKNIYPEQPVNIVIKKDFLRKIKTDSMKRWYTYGSN